MIPQLTETWAGAYLQIIVVLIVFALGIPALIFQLAIPEDIRRVINRRIKITWWYFLLIILGVASLLFVWILHPCSSGYTPIWKDIASAAIITILLISVLLFWWSNLFRYTRKRIIEIIEKKLLANYCKSSSLKENDLADLVYLGEQGNPGGEKELILKAFDQLAEFIQNFRLYKGEELEDLIIGIENVLLNKQRIGSDGNFIIACEILHRIRLRTTNSRLNNSHDNKLALVTLGKIGAAAVEMKTLATTLTFLERISSDCCMLFNIGISALNNNRHLVAIAALNKLEALAEDILGSNTATFNLFGLNSHFWSRGGHSRERVINFFKQNKIKLEHSILDIIENSSRYFHSIIDFSTADMLTAMKKDIRKSKICYSEKMQKL